ncbi:competence protein ComFA [Natronobacillus azotifigens]|uniref:DEAD/DEAH box helicase n=1 Tax=Natronobacillus azotifigens TaxID=472978 RepID=A0A9J6R9Y5_9BACI|nr:DEAD/DEAH box helicase [Natronobacillus azotifigens]MCZ0702123.1 DEAD/DEAH box helicase [Natronobacillus azotifigens]
MNKYANRYDGRLLLRSEISLDEITFLQLRNEKKFQRLSAFIQKRYSSQLQCRRCGNNKKHLLGIIPCQACKQTHHYCRNCIEMGRVMTCEPLYIWTGPPAKWPSQADPCQWSGELTHVQQRAAERIVQAIQAKEKELLIWAVCGAGKTEMLFAGIAHAIQAGKRVCLATPRADVVRELYPRFQQAFPNTTLVALHGGSGNNHDTAQLTITTTHQLLRYQQAFDIMIIDEIDAFPFHADQRLPFVTNRSVKKNATMLYLTATPRKNLKKRSNKGELATIFVPVRYHGQPLPVPRLKMTAQLARSLTRAKLPTIFWGWYHQRSNPNRQVLIFVPTIAQANHLTEPLQKNLPQQTVTSVHANDPDRTEKVQQFRNKQIDTLLTTTILERGVTFPSVDVAVIDAGHDVFDEAALVQIAGRAGRSPNDPTGEVIFFHQGKTEAMLAAIRVIKQMNKKACVINREKS